MQIEGLQTEWTHCEQGMRMLERMLETSTGPIPWTDYIQGDDSLIQEEGSKTAFYQLLERRLIKGCSVDHQQYYSVTSRGRVMLHNLGMR